MTDKERNPLPKFGSWDVNNPAAAGQYSVIFDRARNEKRAEQERRDAPRLSSDKESSSSFSNKDMRSSRPSSARRWFCFSSPSYAES